jgi:hypothetical protein
VVANAGADRSLASTSSAFWLRPIRQPLNRAPSALYCAARAFYSSQLSTWRRERQAGILKGLTPLRRGPKSERNPHEEEMQKLRGRISASRRNCVKPRLSLMFKKKVGALLGWPLPKADPEEQS